MEDLESGTEFLSLKLKKFIKWYKTNQKSVKTFLISFLLLSIAIIIKKGFNSFESAIETVTAISMDEELYIPFQLGEFTDIPSGDSCELVIKDSMVNRRMQLINIDMVVEEVREFLVTSGNICIHLKHFGVSLDIVVFPNQTVINPHVISQGSVWKNVPEMKVSGEEIWSRRATSLYVKFYNAELTQVYDTLWNEQAFCLAHYIL